MNRKNLTAAVLAGLAGAAGLAGTAQAVNLNPDGLGQVLIYPYFTSNDGNQTVLSVVNTTDQAKAVKVRFLEGYNSREVLDFNLYLSAYDVWVAGIADVEGTPNLFIPDTSCTVPYLYGMGIEAGMDYGMQPFLPYDYTGKREDGGPTDIARAAEGHFEMIEMGTLVDEDTCVGIDTVDGNECPTAATKTLPERPGAATAATHVLTEDGPMPYDCEVLVENWTGYGGAKPHPNAGVWFEEGDRVTLDTRRNSGGLFGGAAVINAANGTMFSYDAKAIQGYDKTDNGVHFQPGDTNPSLDDGSEETATVFFGVPQNKAVQLEYEKGVDAISAVFMHDHMMNTYTIEEDLNAASEFVFTFPTKSFYVDEDIVGSARICTPDPEDQEGCEGWDFGDDLPPGLTNPSDLDDDCYWDDSVEGALDYLTCDIIETTFTDVRPPFTEGFQDGNDGQACEIADVMNWDREESPGIDPPGGNVPPIVSPPPPGPPPPGVDAPFALCYEVNRLEVGGGDIFGETGLLSTTDLGSESGWVKLDFSYVNKDGLELHQDRRGLVGLPVTGFVAERYENGFLEGGSVLANYGGLFQHKASVRRISPDCEYHELGDCE